MYISILQTSPFRSCLYFSFIFFQKNIFILIFKGNNNII